MEKHKNEDFLDNLFIERSSNQTDSIQNTKVLDNFYHKISIFFRNFTGHDIKCVSSFENFVEFMHEETDAASIGIGRILFGKKFNKSKVELVIECYFSGIMMLLDIPEERSGADLDLRWGEPRDCRFPLINFISTMSLPRMGLLYITMWLGLIMKNSNLISE